MAKFNGNEDSRPNTGSKMGDSPKGGGAGGSINWKGMKGLGPSGGSWKGSKDSRPKCTDKMGDGGK